MKMSLLEYAIPCCPAIMTLQGVFELLIEEHLPSLHTTLKRQGVLAMLSLPWSAAHSISTTCSPTILFIGVASPLRLFFSVIPFFACMSVS